MSNNRVIVYQILVCLLIIWNTIFSAYVLDKIDELNRKIQGVSNDYYDACKDALYFYPKIEGLPHKDYSEVCDECAK